MKCELCDSDATFHTTIVDSGGNAASRSLCESHGRLIATESGIEFPSREESLASIVASAKGLAEFLRANRRMPTSDEMAALGGAIGIPCHDSDERIDVFIAYFNSLAEFVTGNGRFPTEDELRDPF